MLSHHKLNRAQWQGVLLCQAAGLMLLAPSRAVTEEPASTSKDETRLIERAFYTGRDGTSDKAGAGQLVAQRFGTNHLLIGHDAGGSVSARLTCLLCNEDELLSETRSLGAVVAAKSRGGSVATLDMGSAKLTGHLYIDGIPLALLPGAHPIEPGSHEITLVNEDAVRRASVRIPKGSRVALPALDAGAPDRTTRVRSGVITCGLGLTVAAVGGLLMWLDNNCATKDCDMKHTYLKTPGMVLLATGVFVQGIVIWLLWPKRHAKKEGAT